MFGWFLPYFQKSEDIIFIIHFFRQLMYIYRNSCQIMPGKYGIGSIYRRNTKEAILEKKDIQKEWHFAFIPVDVHFRSMWWFQNQAVYGCIINLPFLFRTWIGRVAKISKKNGTLLLSVQEGSKWIYHQTWTIGKFHGIQLETLNYDGIKGFFCLLDCLFLFSDNLLGYYKSFHKFLRVYLQYFLQYTILMKKKL